MDMALSLRTVAMRGSKVLLQAGGGIVYDSTPDFEYQETINKMAAPMRAIDVAETLERDEREAQLLTASNAANAATGNTVVR